MSGKIRFGRYELDRDAMELRKDGVLVRLQVQPLRVLAMLTERPGETITREQLQERIWGNTFVDFDQSLNKAVNRVREALNDNAGTPQYVETVPRRGYRFIASVALQSAVSVEIPAQPRSDKSPSRTIVLAALTRLGGSVDRIVIVGCQPGNLDEGIGLSRAVRVAVVAAVDLCLELVAHIAQPAERKIHQ